MRVLLALLTLVSVCVYAGGARADVAGSAAARDPGKLRLGSVTAAVMDSESGKVLYDKRPGMVVPIASITKLMTAMVVLDGGQSLDEWIEIVKPDLNTRKNAYSRMRIGSMARRGDLLHIALMSSENLAAYVLGYHYPGGMSAFVAAMNAKAGELGMDDTRFADSTGLLPANRSTAKDLGKMVMAASGYEPIRAFTTTSRYHVTFRKPRYTLGYVNTNPLVRRGRWEIDLSKTGYLTEAGRCLVMMMAVDKRDVVIVLLNSYGTKTPIGDAGRIRRWIRTGDGGPIASAAWRYQKERGAHYEQTHGERD